MAFEWYESDDSTPAGTAYTLDTSAGTPSAAIELHAWLNKGSSVGDPETRYLRVYVEDPASPGTYRTSGLDTLDRREFEIRIIGSQNPDLVPGFVVSTTAWQAVGKLRTFSLPAIYPNCAIEIEVRVNPLTEGGSSSPATFYIKAIQGAGENGEDLPMGGHTISDGNLTGMTLTGALDGGGQDITNLYTSATTEDDYAATNLFVMQRPAKTHCRLVALSPVTWPNAVTNGDFATVLTPWTGTSWAQSAGTALHTAGSTAALAYALTVVDAVRYRITVTVSGAAGTVTPMIGADTGTPIAAGAGTVTQEILSTAGGALSVSFVPTSDFDGALDDILVETMFYGLPDDIDSTAVADADRLLLAAEVDGTRNGKWIAVDAGPWTRHPDCADTFRLYAGCFLYVREGSAGRTLYIQTADIADLSTDPQTWEVLVALP